MKLILELPNTDLFGDVSILKLLNLTIIHFINAILLGNISRRCDEQGRWQEVNVKNCRSLEPQKPVNSGKQTSNDSHGIPHEEVS